MRKVTAFLVCGTTAALVGYLAGEARFVSSRDPYSERGGELHAKSFVVVDDSGKECARFGLATSGLGKVGGESLLELGISRDMTPVVVARSDTGERRIGLTVTKSGAVGLALYDTSRTQRCGLFLEADGSPQVLLNDSNGRARAQLSVDREGVSALDLRDGNEKGGMVLQVDRQGKTVATTLNGKEEQGDAHKERSP
ncbi:MAG: hypothetical protein HY763_04980 [Planctomycetes bacterium]|nr:hypothetical protein [Planctomycetota bacterium]